MRKTNLATTFLAMALSTGAARAQDVETRMADLYQCTREALVEMFPSDTKCDDKGKLCHVVRKDGSSRLRIWPDVIMGTQAVGVAVGINNGGASEIEKSIDDVQQLRQKVNNCSKRKGAAPI